MKIDYDSGSNVVSLMPRRNEMIFPALREVEAYWDGLRNGRPVPARSDIDPRGMQSSLEFAFILERIAPGVARFRLAGMHLTDLMGMEVRGMPLTAIFVPESRAKVSAVIESVCDSPQIATLTLKGERGIGRGSLDAQLLLCPLKSDLGDVNRILGCLQSKGDIGRQPRRFEAVETVSRALMNGGVQDRPMPEGITEKGTPIPQGFAEARKAYLEQKDSMTPAQDTPQPPRPTGKPALRLVSTDD
ncbi:PAS domain-containing protein [Pacificibacter marinus]|uniref:PAS domain-containing protein n=1 Tax=Pacificibacter marinus TaxID=658057 RepID=UPI001C07934D|nr:PAS domain-containing protein [Pacificibacter marinus]MBU2866280.1 PAS domain-containing protein [Pacificibacter marinus]